MRVFRCCPLSGENIWDCDFRVLKIGVGDLEFGRLECTGGGFFVMRLEDAETVTGRVEINLTLSDLASDISLMKPSELFEPWDLSLELLFDMALEAALEFKGKPLDLRLDPLILALDPLIFKLNPLKPPSLEAGPASFKLVLEFPFKNSDLG